MKTKSPPIEETVGYRYRPRPLDPLPRVLHDKAITAWIGHRDRNASFLGWDKRQLHTEGEGGSRADFDGWEKESLRPVVTNLLKASIVFSSRYSTRS
jgi:hypothetical protein